MKYSTITTIQLLLFALIVSLFTALLISVNTWYMVFMKLPVVHSNSAGECVSVENFENGHAFVCDDVDVLLRQYRRSAQ